MSHAPSLFRRPRALLGRWAAAVAVVSLLVPSAALAQARSSGEVASELETTERRAGQLGEQLSGVRARIEQAEIELASLGLQLQDARGRLRAAEGQVALAEAALEETQRVRDRADRAYRRAEDTLARTQARLDAEESTLVEQLVETFKYGTAGATQGAMAIEVLRRAADPNAFAVGLKQLQVVVDTQESTVQSVFALRQQRADQAETAARARSRAAQAAADAAATLRTVEELRAEAAQLTVDIAAAEEQQQAVLATLEADESETAALLQRVSTRQQELADELARTRTREDEASRTSSGSATSTGVGGGGPYLEGGHCPVVGAVADRDFSNDWGYPRSGGRTHQGTDIFANSGKPVVAVADGIVVRMNPASAPTGLGGITVTYRTADGSEWYNAHLRDIAAGVGVGTSVRAGQPIGSVGNTGNARTTPPHLHLGRKYGGSWVNPYPTISRYCR